MKIRRRHHLLSTLAILVLAGCATETVPEATGADEAAVTAAAVDWSPGHYVIIGTDSTRQRDTFLASATAKPFTGIQRKYDWYSFEGAKGDYRAGFALLDDDLRAAAKAGKKLLAMVQYKQFGRTPHAVPDYMLKPGPWCVGGTCGEYEMSNGVTAILWQPGVAERLHAWLAAMGAHVAASPYRSTFAGIVLPETALSEGKQPLASIGYTQPVYLHAIEANLLSLIAAFRNKPIFQYINFFPPNKDAGIYLEQLADFAVAHPNVGLGCPDVGPKMSPPGYDVLKNATYQRRLPFNVAVEAPDFGAARTTGLQPTYDLAVVGMRAEYVSWFAGGGNGPTDVFSLDDVSRYVAKHPIPNITVPTW